MSTYQKMRHLINKNYSFLFNYIPLCFCVCFIAFMLLRFPETAGQGVTNGIDICLGTLVPSLYPFMILSGFLVNFDLLKGLQKITAPIMKLLFRLPSVCTTTIFMSMIGGLPVGGKMTQSLFESEQISRSQGQRMLLFCINPGPAFVISTVGLYMLGSKYVGVILFTSLIISTLIMGFLSRFFSADDDFYMPKAQQKSGTNIPQALVNSVSQGSMNILSVCAWVLLFSCIIQLIEILPFSEEGKFFSYCILEVTNGCLYACGSLPLPIIAGIIAFGGICAHCQIMSAVIKLGLKLKYFFTARILNAAIAVVVCQALYTFSR